MLNKDVITSRNNTLVKWVASLLDKKGRQASSAFIAEGVKLTLEAIHASLPITHIFISEERKDELLPKVLSSLNEADKEEVEIFILSTSVFKKISTEKAPQGVISVIKYLDFFFNIDIIYKEEFFLPSSERAIALCSVRDPSNLGAVIRSSVAFGVDHIILTDDCADLYNPKTVRSAMGSLFKVKTSRIKSFSDFISSARSNGRRVLCAELSEGAASLNDANLVSSDIVVIGNEGHGIPRDVSQLSDGAVYIPISNKTESLNAAVAAGIFMWEQSKS